jgi:hypothetical protein
MGKIDNYLSFVKEQVGVQEKLAKKYEDSPFRKGQHLASAKNMSELADFLTEIQAKGTRDVSYLNRGDSPQKKLLLTLEEIEGLPEELLKELNLTETDRHDLVVEHLIAQAGGILSLDKIMVQLWKRTGEVPKRNTITSRLYRMVAKGMIYNVPGKKGVYSTYEVSEQEAKRLFGTDGEAEEPSAQTAAENASASQPTLPTKATPVPAPPKHLFEKNRVRFSSSTTIPRRV